MLKTILLLTSIGTALPGVQVEPSRLSLERAADRDVLASLRRNGDCPSIQRSIDVRFVGAKEQISALEKQAPALGFLSIETSQIGKGNLALDITIQSNTTEASIDNLTSLALRIERRFGVRYDGWGTVATRC